MDGIVKNGNAANRSEFGTLRGHVRWVYAVAFSPGSPSLASATADGTITICNARP